MLSSLSNSRSVRSSVMRFNASYLELTLDISSGVSKSGFWIWPGLRNTMGELLLLSISSLSDVRCLENKNLSVLSFLTSDDDVERPRVRRRISRLRRRCCSTTVPSFSSLLSYVSSNGSDRRGIAAAAGVDL